MRFLRPAAAGILLTAGLGLSACKDYLDIAPPAYNTLAETFSTVDGATVATLAAYDLLSGDAGYGSRLSCYLPYDDDEMVNARGAADATRRGISRYMAIPSNSEVVSMWNTLYQGIERANICLKNIPEMPQYKAGTANEQAALRRLHGEMLTVRAQYFLELARNWGDIPEPRTASVTGQDFNLVRTSHDSVYAHLVKDLALAEDLVPWRSNSATANERVTQGAVRGLRARIALMRGGWSLDRAGNEHRPSDYLAYYAIARAECEILMQHRSEHSLNASFATTFRSIANIDGSAPNATDDAHEIMFAVGAGGASVSDTKMGYYNGPRFSASPTYGTSSGAITIVPTYFYAFDSLDTRRDVTITPYVIDAADAQKGVRLLSVTDGKYRRDWRSPPLGNAVQSLSFDWVLLRFSDVLLMFAEADNELNNGPTPAATAALMEVRRRGYGANAAIAPPAPSSKTDFFNAIVQERHVEFGGEGIRKYDLIRWNLMTDKIAETRLALKDFISPSATSPYRNVPTKMYYTFTNGSPGGLRYLNSFYRPAPASTPTGASSVNWRSDVNADFANTQWASGYQQYKQVLPIPQGALDTDPNLYQNYGY